MTRSDYIKLVEKTELLNIEIPQHMSLQELRAWLAGVVLMKDCLFEIFQQMIEESEE